MRRLGSLALCCLALVPAACGSDDDTSGTMGESDVTTNDSSTAGGGVEVSMEDIAFKPETTDVKVGQKVTWTNDESVAHNVVARSGAGFESSTFNEGGRYSFTPKKAGTVRYTCTLHPGMDGTLNVTR